MASSLSAPPGETVPQPEPTGSRLDPRLLNRLCWIAVATLLLTHAVLVWQSRIPAVTPSSNDDALYLLLGRSLRSFHYLDVHVVGTPVHAQYPPVYPALIGVATAIFGEHLDVVLGLTLLCSLVSLLLLYDMGRRLASPLVGLLVMAPIAVNSHLLVFTGRIAAEMPYVAFSFATLWVLVAWPAARRTLLYAGILAILAGLTRSVGITMVGAVFLLWAFQRRFKAATILLAVSLLSVGGWLYWTAVAPNQFTERSYAAVATKTARHLPGPLGLLEVRSQKFVKVYVSKSFSAGLEVPTLAGSSIDNAAWVIAIVVLGGIGLWYIRKRAPILPIYLISYFALLLVYPYKLTRFYMPVAPLLLLAMFLGLYAIGRRWKPQAALLVMVLIAAGIMTQSIPKSLKLVRNLEDCDRSKATVSSECFASDRLAFFEAARLANATLPRNAVVLTIKEATFFYWTGLKVYHPDLAEEKGGKDVAGYLDRMGIHYVMINAFVGGAAISRQLIGDCRRIEVLRTWEPRTALLQIHPVGTTLTPSQQSCSQMEQWSQSTKGETVFDEFD